MCVHLCVEARDQSWMLFLRHHQSAWFLRQYGDLKKSGPHTLTCLDAWPIRSDTSGECAF